MNSSARQFPGLINRQLGTAFVRGLLLLALLPAAVQAQYSYITNNGTVTITGYGCINSVAEIPASIDGLAVTGISDNAFRYCEMLTHITIPSSVTNIRTAVVFQCPNVTAITVDPLNPAYSSIDGVLFDKSQSLLIQYPPGRNGSFTVPNTVTDIGDGAFAYCYGLTGVALAETITRIGDSAFLYCLGLTNLAIPHRVTSIGSEAFSHSGLTDVTIPNSVTSLGEHLFHNSLYLASVTIPGSVTNIGNFAFYGCASLTNLAIPDSVTSIGNYAFEECSGLTSVTIPRNVTIIGGRAFFKCTSLTNITIGKGVLGIGSFAFSFCRNFTEITVDLLNPVYHSTDGVLFNKSHSLLIQYPEGKVGGYVVPGGVTSIGGAAFAYCRRLTSVAIPASVSSIEGSVFYECSSLTSLTIPGGVPAIGSYLFYNCAALTNVTIPNSVTNIGEWAFYGCISLRSVMIPDSVAAIEDYSFYYCTGVTNVAIGDGVARIGGSAFANCQRLTEVYFRGDRPSPDLDVLTSVPATVNYLPGTTGWGLTFAGRPTAPWLLPDPVILNSGSSFGVQTNGFGFVISWAQTPPSWWRPVRT